MRVGDAVRLLVTFRSESCRVIMVKVFEGTEGLVEGAEPWGFGPSPSPTRAQRSPDCFTRPP